jgi:hypothetical protein
MTLLSTGVYEDAQYQAEAPIGVQSQIPAGVHDIELSWDRHKGYMRIIINREKWWFKELLGKAVATYADSEKGRLHFYGMARIDGETLTLYRPPDAEPHPVVVGLVRSPSLYRTCYRRSDQKWRARDERMPWNAEGAMIVVNDVVGDFAVEWRVADKVAHIFHRGWEIIDDKGICHLYDPDLTYA